MFQEILSEQDIEEIHDTSMSLLGNVGVEFPYEGRCPPFRARCQDRWQPGLPQRRPGYEGSGIGSAAVCDPCPQSRPQRGRRRWSTSFCAGLWRALPGGCPSADGVLQTGADHGRLCQPGQACPRPAQSGPERLSAGRAGGCAHRKAHLQMLQAHMVHSDKPFIGSTEGLAGARHTMEMASILFGRDVKD